MRSSLVGLPLLLATSCVAMEAPTARASPGDASSALDPLAVGERYVNDADFRRSELVASLVNPDNAYSRLRLERYTEEDWGALPEWNPRALPITLAATRPPPATSPEWQALDVDAVPWNEAALVELGRVAFLQYPVQLLTALGHALGDPARAARYGFQAVGDLLGGTVWAELPVGPPQPAVTCAACHASVSAGTRVPGKKNAALDLGALIGDSGGGAPIPWGPGRVDVTNDGVENPTAIPDLRAVRSEVTLQRTASVRNGLVPLAIRTETLVTTSLGGVVRPPRKVAFALALYLWQLEPVPVRAPDEAASRGESLLSVHCAGCHEPPGFSGPPVALGVVGTDPAVGSSAERFTGFYGVPSLRGVGDRVGLLAGGQIADLRELLSTERSAAGHPFGTDLGPVERADLIAYLETL